jgi:signal transduction histidine kinase
VRRLWIGLLAAGILLGVGAESASWHPHRPELNAADLTVGWTFIACGVIAWSRRPASRIGALLCVTGFAWLLGSFESSDVPALATIGGLTLTLHRGPLVHTILSYPTGRLSRRADRIVVLAAYLDGAIVPLAQSNPVTIVLAVALLGAAVHGYITGTAPERRARAPAVGAAAALALVLAIGSAYRMGGTGTASDRVILWAYELVLFVTALSFLADLLWGRWAHAAMTGLVVELGEGAPSATLRDRLAHAVGDRALVLGYWLPEEGRYVDDRGAPVAVPEGDPLRKVTLIEHGGERIAALVHDPAVLEDPKLIDSVRSAVRIAIANVRLEAEVRAKIVELERSRRRILEAADDQRRRLERELHEGAEQRLADVEDILQGAFAGGESPLGEVLDELRSAKAELREFANGIHPRVLTEGGLAAAVASIAERAVVPVTLGAPAERFEPAIEAVAYFVCSEALANVGKYARASTAEIAVGRREDWLTVTISDDGVGGAHLHAGSGLRGLVDRVEAVGGRLELQSPPGRGTRLHAELPLRS